MTAGCQDLGRNLHLWGGGLLHASPIAGALSHLILTTILQIATFVEEEVEA